MKARLIPLIAVLSLSVPYSADAALTSFQTHTGQVAVSTDGFGSTDEAGVISADVPAGATVIGAFLYTATYFNATHTGVGATLNGGAVAFGPPVENPDICCDNAMARADVTGDCEADN